MNDIDEYNDENYDDEGEQYEVGGGGVGIE
jgi:hypothetical protein